MTLSAPLLASLVAMIPAVILDEAIHGIQQWQRKSAGMLADTPGLVARLFMSILINFALSSSFCYLYAALWSGSGRVLLYGGTVWLLIAIPFFIMMRQMDDFQRKILTTRIFGWLFKIGAATASLTYFIG